MSGNEEPAGRRFEGSRDGTGLRVAIAQSRFNWLVGEKLTHGATEALVRHGVERDAIDVFIVPGAFELPAIARRISDTGQYHAIICLGVVVRGDTPHFDYVCAESARGIADVAFGSPCAVTFGVLTTDTMEQALERAGGKVGNKGEDAAVAALELVDLYRRFESEDDDG
ncbi:MAG: 6,7-dimethyl-8-ribityllumazine synthase [Planctomycetes bacterium]|nr:6,7-dimethyl-8-ribityllumazine synthase [Planctomycetota bacterium]